MPLEFKFKKFPSIIFKEVRRPIAFVDLKVKKTGKWLKIRMIVDTGADYTLLPKWLAEDLAVDLNKDCDLFETGGVGGFATVYLLKEKMRAKLGNWERKIPLGFLDNDKIPPLFGRQEFLETFKATFHKHVTRFEEE